MRLPALSLGLLCILASALAGGGSSEGVSSQEPTLEVKLATVREAIDEVKAVRDEGELDLARNLTAEALGMLEALTETELEKALGLVIDLDEVAGTLGLLEVQRACEERIVAVMERSLPADHADLLAAKLNLAGTLANLGDMEGARELLEFVHAAWERLLPADHANLLTAKANLAGTRYALGDLKGALELYELVHAARERTLPADAPDLLTVKLNLALTRKALGDLEGARELEELVLTVRVRTLPPNHPELLKAKMNLAGTRHALGDLEGARELFETVHAALVLLLPPDHPYLLTAKANLALTRSALGDLEGARELEEFVHAAWERLLPIDNADLLTVKMNLAATREALGDLEGARELMEVVHTARTRLLPAEHPDLLKAKLNLALTLYALGDLEDARELMEVVHTARERLLPSDHPDLLKVEQNLALTRRTMGDLEGARELLRSLLAGQVTRSLALRVESPRIARSAALRELQRFSEVLVLSRFAGPEAPADLDLELFAVLENLRRVSTSSSEVALAFSRSPELKDLGDRLSDIGSELNGHSLSPPREPDQVEAWRKELLSLAARRDRLQRELRAKLQEKGVFSGAITSARVAHGLDEGSLAICFHRYSRYFEEDLQPGKTLSPVDSLMAFVVTPDAAVRRVELGPSAELEALTLAWRRALGKPVERGVGVGDPVDSKESEEVVGARLREKLIAPCLVALGGEPPKQLHVVLDDFLHLVPIDALPWKEGKRLGEVSTIHNEVSMQRLAAPPPAVSGAGTLVALGGVDFGTQEEGTTKNFEYLLQTRYEVEALGGQFKETLGEDPVVLVGERATKTSLVKLASTARFLHVATHGWFESEAVKSLRDSAEEEADKLGLERAEETLRGFAPETLCGLALAGANHGPSASTRVPGILTAEELATLDLSSCELAVLSACETNVGLRRAGQGIQSLQGALHAAGARTAITSLWRVDDAATRRLMELFYSKLWGEGLGKAEALWRAKMALRGEQAPTRDWAGWVLSGDPR